MKKDLFIKILKYIGVACLGAVIGMGALAGVSSCYSNNKTAKTHLVRHNAILNNDNIDSIIGSNDVHYVVAKNITTNGAGVFYENSISLENSRIMSNKSLTLSIKGFVISGNTRRVGWLDINTAQNAGVYKLSRVYLTINGTITDIYNASQGVFNRNIGAFTIVSCKYALESSSSHTLSFLTDLFNVYRLNGNSFTFNDNINYYAPYGQDIDNYYVNDANMTEPSSYSVKTILEGYLFYSGGMVFDTIRLRYQNAIATSYLDDNGNRKTWMTNDFASFMFVEYVNTATNYVLVVNDRVMRPWQESNQSGYYLTKSSKWVSDYYKKIEFFVDVYDVIITNLSILNNSSYEGGYVDNSQYSDVGLSSAFTLLGQAFASWVPILNISIIPGITLGLLLFLPLIVGIIILVVWVVKR